MSVLIKGMDMPKDCFQCPFLYTSIHRYAVGHAYESYTCLRTGKEDFRPKERMLDCPLVEVPPHGDLIDRSELLKKEQCFGDCEYTDYGVETGDIEEAPVVIPAEEEKE